MKKCLSMSLVGMMVCTGVALASPINQTGTFSGTGLIDFENAAIQSYDSVLTFNHARFAERFVGQTNTPDAAGFDVLAGTPIGPLTLQTGNPLQNVNLFGPDAVQGLSSRVLSGLGSFGYPSFSAIGEGSIAVLFNFEISTFGFDLVGTNNGSAFLSFFKRDGTVIDTVTVSGLDDQQYSFSRDGGLRDIAGISLYNDDIGGIGVDNIRFDVPAGTAVPEPSSFVLLGAGLVAAAVIRRKRR